MITLPRFSLVFMHRRVDFGCIFVDLVVACIKLKHTTQRLPKRRLEMKKKQIRKPKTHVIANEPDDITLELAKTMAEIKSGCVDI